MSIGLFIGRFQPFHKGHLWAIREILKDCDTVIIGIGSSQHKRTPTNPFTTDERKDILTDALKKAEIDRFSVFLIPDINDDGHWVNHVNKIIPKFDYVYTGSPLSRKLFTEKGYIVKILSRHRNISASEVRLRIHKGLEWKELVCNPELLEKMGAEQIIKSSERLSVLKRNH